MYDPEVALGVWSEGFIKNVTGIVEDIWKNHKYKVDFVHAAELKEHKYPDVCRITVVLTNSDHLVYEDVYGHKNFNLKVGNAVEVFIDQLIAERDRGYSHLVETPNHKNQLKLMVGGYGREQIEKWNEEQEAK